MGTRINTNVGALFSALNLNRAYGSAQQSIEKLSSGLRVLRSADDPGAISPIQRLRVDVASYAVSAQNAAAGIPLVQLADEGAASLVGVLQKMRTLSLQAQNGTIDSAARRSYETEFVALKSEIQRLLNESKYGERVLLKTSNTNAGTVGPTPSSTALTLAPMQFAIGPSLNSSVTFNWYQGISSVEFSMRASTAVAGAGNTSLQVGTVSSISSAKSVITAVDAAVKSIAFFRATLGPVQDLFLTQKDNDETSKANLQSALSQIADVDFANEVSNFTSKSILSQAGMAFLAQANLLAQSVLTLLG